MTVSQGKFIPLARKVYVLFKKKHAVSIKVTDTVDEFKEDERLFDEAVAQINFNASYADFKVER